MIYGIAKGLAILQKKLKYYLTNIPLWGILFLTK